MKTSHGSALDVLKTSLAVSIPNILTNYHLLGTSHTNFDQAIEDRVEITSSVLLAEQEQSILVLLCHMIS